MNIAELYQCFLQSEGITTDTRAIRPNTLFFALKGDNFDGNNFAQEALEQGASFVVMDNKRMVTDPNKMLYVKDSLQALQALAKYHRQQLGLPIIALTGSNGKTTTKELILTVLEQKYNTKATKGNLNNHIGVPLTLLSFDEDTDIGIVEMGANHKQEIALLCSIAEPDFGYITNFGKAHLEGFGSIEGVIKAKSELYEYLEDNYKIAFVNLDDAMQDAKTLTFSRYGFGQTASADVLIQQYIASPNAGIVLNDVTISSNLTGIYNTTNIAAAVAIGRYFDISLEDIKMAIENYTATNNRSQWITAGSTTILLDAYNANPSSMEASISNFKGLASSDDKVYILGDMFELGKASKEEHQAIVKLLTEEEHCFFIGKQFSQYQINVNPAHHFFTTLEDFTQYFKENTALFLGKTTLLKGSRGMALERVVPLYTA